MASQRFASQSAVSAQINDSKRLLLAGASISKKVAFMTYIDSLKLALCITHAAYITIESNGPFDVESIIKDLY